ncbi:MAG: alkaline phosphatase D family protein [Acidobacteriota bacterium]
MTDKQATRSSIQRRHFLKSTAATIGSAFLIPIAGATAGWTKNDSTRFADNPFSLGVASGDPRPDGVVLWTRLAPDPLNGGGMPATRVPVAWELARDERMQQIVAKGKVSAVPESAHSVRVEVEGLKPEQWYWYRFTVDAGASVVGRTRTAPAAHAQNEQLKFAFASCQHYETGHYNAYRHLAQDDLDLVFFLGDYIYEGPATDRVRKHNSPEITTLEAYRNRYALYKGDSLLQEAHARFPWAVIWDDHEVENNYAGLISQDKVPVEEFKLRRAAAYQAWYEHQPVRRSTLRPGGTVEIYRQLRYGNLANFYLLDTRQYRTDQPCGDGAKAPCAESLDSKATILGEEQEKWLKGELSRSKARWNVIAQQVMMAQVDSGPAEEKRFPMDQWNGYAANRRRLLEFLKERQPSNPIVVTGDIHSNWVADLKPDFDRADSPVVGTEFVGTSITTGGDGSDHRPNTPLVLSKNPHIKFFNGQRGYVRCAVNPKTWQTDFRVVAAVATPNNEVSTRASFVVEDGRPGAKV